ncbi:Receptor protein-tyrosine kinase CEPR1 [Vitis vinifera]|uniref:Receptor protein-tyrosine kinase CEPR1 n=1 Tax=Vitis vinifera TaxID=29760 RepID=A0A438F887_VITVI|nr:Receptor protein-tyrosine kinase CEPR1 [Vitis vinifera]
MPSQASITNQSHFFTLMKNSLSGDSLSDWDVTGKTSYCNYSGVSCNDEGYVEVIDISGWSLSGRFPPDVCSYLPQLRVLRLSYNDLHDNFPEGIVNCSLLEELDMNGSQVIGTLPDLSPMKSLRILDLSYNLFTGELTKLKSMILTTCMVHGQIPPSIGNMTSLVDLQLSGNFLNGQIPAELGLLKNLRLLELYYNQIAAYRRNSGGNWELNSLGHVINLRQLLTGGVQEVWDNGFNNLNGQIGKTIGTARNLSELFIQSNRISGALPPEISQATNLVKIDLSNNLLSGPIPSEIGNLNKLNLLLLQGNKFNSAIPKSLSSLKSVNVLDLSNNRLTGRIQKASLNYSNFPICSQADNRKKLNCIWVIGASSVIVIVGVVLFLKR